MAPGKPDISNRHWHVGREVPVALIVTVIVLIVGQTAGAFWWSATLAARLETVERDVRNAAPQAERIIRLEEKVGVVQQGINEIKAILARPPR